MCIRDSSWSDSFDLNVYSDDSFMTHITTDTPISLGSPVYGQISTLQLPNALQYFVEECYVSPDDSSNDSSNESSINLFDNYECYNPIFGDANSIFMGRTRQTPSLDDFNFSFPAFTFSNLIDDQLHMVSR